MNKLLYFLLATSLFIASCTATKPSVSQTTPIQTETRTLDELVVKAKKTIKDPEKIVVPTFHGSRTLDNDLIHSNLAVSFNIPEQELMGKATLTLKPIFYPVDQLELDAKGFTFSQVRLNGPHGPSLKYHNSDTKIYIDLDRYFSRKETYKVYLEYVAHPTEGPKGGSSAIQSDQGLYFIDPKDLDPEKPTQIWTQGETESNSRWCPTIDSPNERATHELAITVPKKYKTLSNGVFVKSINNGDTRTDYWKMEIPTAPYLMMMAVGDFAIVRDTWQGKPIAYYVEPEYEAYAKNIFPYTKELLTFYSDILQTPYPWPKYDQIVVRDFVSGAMENTTAVVFQEFMNGTTRELSDQHRNELIVAHEMFHHWFGDYVTCESWANTTLNEGFANYSEYLWLEHKYGKDEADKHLQEQLDGYIRNRPLHPLINYHYKSREDMFDAHSYNKGGCTLHMLRNSVGDEAFFSSLNKYLKDNALTSVEIDELRMAFEDNLGQDFHWFFDQWYEHSGHPILEVTKSYDASAKILSITIEQVQKGDDIPEVYYLPLKVGIYNSAGKIELQSIEMNARKQTFEIGVDYDPIVVDIDPEGVLVGIIHYLNRSDVAWKELYHFHPAYRSRKLAAQHLLNTLTDSQQLGFSKTLLEDSFWEFRQMGLMALDGAPDKLTQHKIEQLATNDSNTTVRALAIKILAQTKDQKYVDLFTKILQDNSLAYTVTGAALSALNALQPTAAAKAIKSLEDTKNQSILGSIGNIYAENPSKDHLDFFKKNLKVIKGYEAVEFYGNYAVTALTVDPDQLPAIFLNFKNISTDMTQAPERRFSGAKIMSEFVNQAGDHPLIPTLKKYLQEIKEKETANELISIYSQMIK